MKSTLLSRLYAIFSANLGLNFTHIHPRVTRKLFRADASVRQCDGRCCLGGATVSVDERDRVLANAGIVGPEMTSRGRHDPSRWFDRRLVYDHDFTSGWTTGTKVMDGACVFLRED